jgi:hypothetical protein
MIQRVFLLFFLVIAVAFSAQEKNLLRTRDIEERALLDQEEATLWGRLLDDSSMHHEGKKGGKKEGKKGGKKEGKKGGKKEGKKGGKKEGKKGGKKEGKGGKKDGKGGKKDGKGGKKDGKGGKKGERQL